MKILGPSRSILLLILFTWSCLAFANQAPTAHDLLKTLKEDKTSVIKLNGKDPERKKLSYSISQQPQYGSVTLKGKTATYKPNRDYFGADSFQYTANDGELTSMPATVSLIVQSVNDAPVAQSQNLSIAMGVKSTFTLTANDVDNDLLTYRITKKTRKGKVVLNENMATYTPNTANYQGKDSFTFQVSDLKSKSRVTKVDLKIAANVLVCQPPKAQADTNNFEQLDIVTPESDAFSQTMEMTASSSDRPIGVLNDTGITICGNDDSNNLVCPVADYPGQDAEYGRDALAMACELQKIGGGHAGFDFTKLDSDGNSLPANATRWSCVKDNVTGLIWEVKSNDGGLRDKDNFYTWYEPDNGKNGGSPGSRDGGICTGSICDTYGYVQAVNTQNLCGASDWRMPDVNELLSIVNNARSYPAIDTDYFPDNDWTKWNFWSSSSFAAYPYYAWFVDFFYGDTPFTYKKYYLRVRLVRGGH
jgi:hypothetical protein